MAPEEKLKDPLVLLGLGSIFLPFIMILGFQATGVPRGVEINIQAPKAIDATLPTQVI